MTSPDQRGMLFGLFKRLTTAAGWGSVEAAAQRDEFTIRVLGIDPLRESIPSWGKLSQRQVDRLKEALETAIGDKLPVEITEKGTESTGDAAARRRLIYAIERDSTAQWGSQTAGETGIASICHDVHGAGHFSALGRWRELDLPALENLAKTTGRCERQGRRKNSKYREFSA